MCCILGVLGLVSGASIESVNTETWLDEMFIETAYERPSMVLKDPETALDHPFRPAEYKNPEKEEMMDRVKEDPKEKDCPKNWKFFCW